MPEAPITSDAEALRRLMEGNQRYVANTLRALKEVASQRVKVALAQHPFAIIFGCVDSRVPPEIIFDSGLGELFVIRTAG